MCMRGRLWAAATAMGILIAGCGGAVRTVTQQAALPPVQTVTQAVKTVTQPVATTTTETPAPATTSTAPVTNSGSSSASTPAAPVSNLTTSQQNAVAAAKNYLALQGFSEQGLIDQLSSSAGDGYSLSDATVAVDSLHVGWDAQAVRSAKAYLQISSFSCQGLSQQLSSSAGDPHTGAEPDLLDPQKLHSFCAERL